MIREIMEKATTIFLAVAILFSLGCGQQGADSGKIELRWSGMAFPAYDKFRYEQSSLFEKLHPEVKIRYEPISAYTSKIMTQLAGGTAPDVFFVPAAMYSGFVRRGVLMDMTPYLDKDRDFLKQYYPALLANVNYEGKIYGLVSNNSFPVMYYNKTIFDKMKMPYPTNDMTLEETVELAKKMTIRGSDGRARQYGLINGLGWQQLGLLYGGQLWSKDGSKCNINSEPFKKAIRFTKDIYAVYKIAPYPREAQDMGNREQFIGGRAAMYMGGTYEIANFRILNRGAGKLNYGCVMAPVPRGGKRAYLTGGNILGVNARSKNKDMAFELAKFMCGTESIKFLIGVGDSVPL
ncbi:MAG: sugar ABC transporter substrate-binding protein, partial [bacterium]|nr:sugar ABC transporter substrate-binding protein [bacterium]